MYMNVQTIPITKARNEFFDLAMQAYENNMAFAVEKNGILMGGIVPPKIIKEVSNTNPAETEYEERMRLYKKIKQNREKMKMTSNSVLILRKLRRGQYYD